MSTFRDTDGDAIGTRNHRSSIQASSLLVERILNSGNTLGSSAIFLVVEGLIKAGELVGTVSSIVCNYSRGVGGRTRSLKTRGATRNSGLAVLASLLDGCVDGV